MVFMAAETAETVAAEEACGGTKRIRLSMGRNLMYLITGLGDVFCAHVSVEFGVREAGDPAGGR